MTDRRTEANSFPAIRHEPVDPPRRGPIRRLSSWLPLTFIAIMLLTLGVAGIVGYLSAKPTMPPQLHIDQAILDTDEHDYELYYDLRNLPAGYDQLFVMQETASGGFVTYATLPHRAWNADDLWMSWNYVPGKQESHLVFVLANRDAAEQIMSIASDGPPPASRSFKILPEGTYVLYPDKASDQLAIPPDNSLID